MDKMIFIWYLIWASRQDMKEMQVVRYTHILGLIAVIVSVVKNYQWVGKNRVAFISTILIFLLLQILSSVLELYGMADVIVCLVTLVFISVSRNLLLPIELYLGLHAVSGGLLFIVQLCRNNLKGLRLKRPVAYIPYISIAFILTNMVL